MVLNNTTKMGSSKSLAKNTIFLYLRMIVTTLISLYTSRMILKYLGVSDFGTYNAVGGVVSLFSIISGSLTASISRNLTYELGNGNVKKLKKVFCMSMNIQMLLILIVFILSESVAVWFLNSKMVLPQERLYAANWVLQFAILSFSVNLLSIPYSASIISHENMKVFAYMGLVEALLKLVIVYVLSISQFDRLICYSLLLFIVTLVVQNIYWIYCRIHFTECKYSLTFDTKIFHEMFGFASWNFMGATSSILRDQGVTIVLNLFFGPVINAARAISMQVSNVINSFVSNFMMALTPQITKSYAKGDYPYLLHCIYRGSKFSFFLLYLLSLPVLIETEYILNLWLIDVPDTSVWFIRYTLIYYLTDTYSRTLINANNATGDIKMYQIVVGSLNLMVLPIVYIILKFGSSPESSVIVSILISLLSIIPRLYFNKKHFPITFSDFFTRVIIPTLLVSMAGMVFPLLIYYLLPVSLLSFVIISLSCVCSVVISVHLFGCTREERAFVTSFIKNRVLKNYINCVSVK